MKNFSGPYFNLSVFSAGKTNFRNEDAYGFNETTIILTDGATDKSNLKYEVEGQPGKYRTGGEVAADIVVQAALSNDLNGKEFVDTVTEAMRQYYDKYAPAALEHSGFRFSAGGTVLARVVADSLVITQIGDVAFRINEKDVHIDSNLMDYINASIRKRYIDRTGDIPGGREHIMPLLREQHVLHNNDTSDFGYGVLDGSEVPDKFICTFSFDLASIKTLELVTDGYMGSFPVQASVKAYEDMHSYIEEVDPHKINQFISTKPADDRTVLIANFKPPYLKHGGSRVVTVPGDGNRKGSCSVDSL